MESEKILIDLKSLTAVGYINIIVRARAENVRPTDRRGFQKDIIYIPIQNGCVNSCSVDVQQNDGYYRFYLDNIFVNYRDSNTSPRFCSVSSTNLNFVRFRAWIRRYLNTSYKHENCYQKIYRMILSCKTQCRGHQPPTNGGLLSMVPFIHSLLDLALS